MSFFKEFKEDLNLAVNELMPGEEVSKKEDVVINTLEQEVDAQAELDKLEGLFEKVKEPDIAVVKEEEKVSLKAVEKPEMHTQQRLVQNAVEESVWEIESEIPFVMEQPKPEEAPIEIEKEIKTEEIKTEEIKTEETKTEEIKEEIIMNTEEIKEAAEEVVTEVQKEAQPSPAPVVPKEVSDELAVITEGTSLTGNMESTGSIEIRGQVNGNVQCNGKLTVTGIVKGNSSSAEFFADSAKIEGEITTEGTVKIGLGSVVVGNISATSAVIAGAIKGDIDVQGPVVVDTSAVVMGNIKSRSVQINNGAVIEGFCSQCYADVDVNKLFD